ncbi:MAG: MFS transporter [Planctomycetota bacterium]
MPANARLFVWFRVFFNARFYYPVLAIFFVDLGLTLDEYAILNVAWAASIVLFELPLGAVADRIGRRPLVVGAAVIMVVEMTVLAFAPAGNPRALFWIFMVNRVLSGLAEAAASGADEALAYDTLLEEGQQELWPQVLSRLQRRMSVGFMIAMVVGAAVYDPALVNRVCGTEFTQQTTARFPIYLTLALSLTALATSLRMTECVAKKAPVALRESLRETLAAGGWIVAHRFALVVVVLGFLIDSPGRIVVTLNSSLYRLYGIPEAAFGVVGALLGGLGLVSTSIATWMMKRWTPWGIYLFIAVAVLGSLLGMSIGSLWIGVGSMAVLGIGFNLLGFFTSHYLNLVAPSERRATVLSFRSLASNLSYGFFGWGYAILYRWSAARSTEDSALLDTLYWIPIAFFALLVPIFAVSRVVARMCECEQPS